MIVLCRNDRKRHPIERPQPLEEVQIDFKSVSSVPADPEGKQQHVVEVFNFVDAGTSILLNAQVSADFHAQTVLEAVLSFLQTYGCPHQMTFDRDPRFVGGPTGRDFPSTLIRFLLCVGIQPNVCPPHRPDKNAFVERLNRTYQQECLQVFPPKRLSRCVKSRKPSWFITTSSAPIRGFPVTISLRVWLFLNCQACLRFLAWLIPTPG